jgi:PilZ domain
MASERRQYVRRPGPFEGSWNGASGQRECRISDLSPGGCFIDCLTTSPPGTAISVTVVFGDARFTVPGEVVYLDRVQGFGVRFLPSDQTRALAYAMGPTEPLAR